MTEEILATRALWKQAYLDGDLMMLDQLEIESFHVTTDCGPKSKKQQLSSIPKAIAENRYFPDHSRYCDDDIDIYVVGAMALVRGVGRVVTPDGARPPIAFTEIWERIGTEWKVVHLHFGRIAGAS